MNSGRYNLRRPVQSFFTDRAADKELFPKSSTEIHEEKRKEQRRVNMLQQRFTTRNTSFTSGLKLPSIGMGGSNDMTNSTVNAASIQEEESNRKMRRKHRRRRHDHSIETESSVIRPPVNGIARPSSRPGSRTGSIQSFDFQNMNRNRTSSTEVLVGEDYDGSRRRSKKHKKRKHKKKHRRQKPDFDGDGTSSIFDDVDIDLSVTYNRSADDERQIGRKISIQDTFKEIFGKVSDVVDSSLDKTAGSAVAHKPIGAASKSTDANFNSGMLHSSMDVEIGNADDDMMLVEDMDDFLDDDLDDIPAPVKKKGFKVDLKMANALRTVFFGSAKRTFSPAWKAQGFVFNTKAQRDGQLFGMIQHKGGPCGPCAVMQAFVIKHLLFDQPCKDWMNPTQDEVMTAVTAGLVDALVRAGGGMGCSVALIGGRSGIGGTKDYRPDGITECLEVFKMASRQEAMQFLSQQHVIEQFMAPKGCGVILFCYSLVLSRGLDRVRKDADPGFGFMQPFIGEFDYASQELVNLGMTGCAFSNVFDGVKELKGDKEEDCIRLVGIENISKIGFLTLFEHYGHVEVGNNYKSPRYPIWVVCSESHYSVFFQTPRMAKATSEKSRFELCYYDTLARHEEIIRLTIDPQGKHKADETDPPLEKVLRTKWKKCGIKWIGDAVL